MQFMGRIMIGYIYREGNRFNNPVKCSVTGSVYHILFF